jgi:F-type H+-transporting ATPase subunit alpha
VTEVMKQKQYTPMSVAEMALSIYAVNSGYMDKVDRKKIVAFEEALQSFARTAHAQFLKSVNEKPELSKEVDAGYKKICDDFAATGAW